MARKKKRLVKTVMVVKRAKATKKVRKKGKAEAVKRICNLVPSKGTEKDWKYEDAVAAGALGAVAALPPTVDLRQPWWTVGDQGQTGSCVGWPSAHGPILAGLNVDQTWDNATSTKGNLDTPLPKTARGGHAIAVVGYTATGRFIIRNSWGPAWGDNGFAYASPAYITGAFFDESYGVTI